MLEDVTPALLLADASLVLEDARAVLEDANSVLEDVSAMFEDAVPSAWGRGFTSICWRRANK